MRRSVRKLDLRNAIIEWIVNRSKRTLCKRVLKIVSDLSDKVTCRCLFSDASKTHTMCSPWWTTEQYFQFCIQKLKLAQPLFSVSIAFPDNQEWTFAAEETLKEIRPFKSITFKIWFVDSRKRNPGDIRTTNSFSGSSATPCGESQAKGAGTGQAILAGSGLSYLFHDSCWELRASQQLAVDRDLTMLLMIFKAADSALSDNWTPVAKDNEENLICSFYLFFLRTLILSETD